MQNHNRFLLSSAMVLATMLGTASQAHASAKGVGLGVAAGAVSSGTELDGLEKALEPGFHGDSSSISL